MPEVRIVAEPRTEFGKGAARRVRRAGRVPAIVYGHGTDTRHVTLPGLRSTILFVYIYGIIGSFQVFDQVFVMTQGGPIQSTTTVVFRLYQEFYNLNLGKASAIAYVLVLILAAISFVQLRIGEERD